MQQINVAAPGRGWIGFTTDESFLGRAIRWFERREVRGGVKVSHAFVCMGDGDIIEAQASGVVWARLEKYFKPGKTLVFRSPYGYTPQIGASIAEAARFRLGMKYDYGLIVGDALADSYTGFLLNKVFRDWPRRAVNRLLGSERKLICSELAAVCLSSLSEYRGCGVLAQPLDTIDPQALFEDDQIFQPQLFTVNGGIIQ